MKGEVGEGEGEGFTPRRQDAKGEGEGV
jgi:hypothetical protein